MASTNFTTHYSIPLPLGTDLTTPMDYNEAAEVIDTALFGAVTDAGNAAEAASEAVNTANTASAAVDAIGADLSLEKAKIVQLQTRMTTAENDIDDVYTDVTDMITAYKEPSATSTHAYNIGDYYIYNETLYKATATIAIDATIVPNTNCETTNVSSELKQINSDLSVKTTPSVGDVVVGAISYEKVGAVTVLDIHASNMSIAANDWTDWVTLVADFLKPDKTMYLPCSFGQYGSGLIRIDTTGAMRIYNPNNVLSTEIYAQAVIVH